MCFKCSITYATVSAGLLLGSSATPLLASVSSAKVISSQLKSLQELPALTTTLKVPQLQEPAWLQQQNAAEAASRNAIHVVTYDVSTKGNIAADFAQFKAQADATLNDGRGWSRLGGVRFQEVASGGMFTLVLSEASQMTSFSSGCGTEYSCRAGRYVVINQDRWLGATAAWNQVGGSLRDYRHMVINHETGHWLGHDHESCSGPGQPAQVMQQQSINLQGCTFNPWPTASELWSTQLGIAKR